MRKEPLLTGQYYHIYNRGTDKRDIFMNRSDLQRFALSVKEFNCIKPIGSLKDKASKNLVNKTLSDVGRPERPEPLVSVVCYCFNPNHFHFILKQEVDNGISEFLKRLSGGYTKYFNLTHSRSGALFQGRFKSKLINDDVYYLRIRPYVHLNYMLHDIPKDKTDLILSSEKEYDTGVFDLVAPDEAKELLEHYGGNENFRKEALEVVSQIRAERGLTSLLDEDTLP